MNPVRRSLLAFALASLLAGCAGTAHRDAHPPIVFVHGNGDTAALWYPTVWRFESNGWPRERLFAVDLPYPLARSDDSKPQEGRTSAAENMKNLAAEIERVRKLTGAAKVALVGNSRGGNVIRDYIRNGGGAATVSHAVIGGGVNHGVWHGDFGPGSEFNGKGPFMTALNSPQGAGGLETTPGVAFMTLRSDTNDKFAQPDGRWIGQPKMATNIPYDAPALKGAENVVLPGLDHREVSYHPIAFAHTYRFLSGAVPAQTGERLGAAVHRITVGADGQWGPFRARPDVQYEFVIGAAGFATAHYYRPAFPRSSSFIHFRPARVADADKDAASVITMTRPRGYFGVGRDAMTLDGKAPPGLPPGVPGVASSKLKLSEPAVRSVAAVFNQQRIVARSWPLKENRVVIVEFHD